MSSIFEAYDEEFLALTQDIGTNISHLSTYETDAGEPAPPLLTLRSLLAALAVSKHCCVFGSCSLFASERTPARFSFCPPKLRSRKTSTELLHLLPLLLSLAHLLVILTLVPLSLVSLLSQ